MSSTELFLRFKKPDYHDADNVVTVGGKVRVAFARNEKSSRNADAEKLRLATIERKRSECIESHELRGWLLIGNPSQ